MNEAVLSIDDKIINKYNELIAEKESFNAFIKNIVYELLKKINMDEKAEFNTEQLLNILTKNRRMTKRRWQENELKNNLYLQHKIQEQALIIYKKDIDAFKQTYKVDTMDDFKNDMERLQYSKNEKTKTWYKSDNSYLVDFEYLSDKKGWQINQAFQSDSSYIILQYLKSNMSENNTFEMPIVMSDIPVDIGGKRKVSLDAMPFVTTHDNNKEEVYYHDIEKYQDIQINTYIGLDYAQKYCLTNAFKHFNTTDKKIFGYILSRRNADFFETHKIIIDISDIVKNVFEADGSKNYNMVKESIVKMANIKMQFIVKGLSGFISRIFTEVFFAENEMSSNKKTAANTATIYVSDIIVTQLMQQQTIYTYGDKLSDVSNEAFSLICALQGRRMKLYGENKDTIEDILPYYFFQARFRMSDKRKKRNLPIIKKMLEEVKRNNIIIRDFHQIADDFHISYYPLTSNEINKFVDNEDQLSLLPAER